MILRKWNYKKHTYENFEVPDDRDVRLLVDDLEEIIDCANCGRRVKAGDTYTSMTIHNSIGLEYCVCEECYEKEWKEHLSIRSKTMNNKEKIKISELPEGCIIWNGYNILGITKATLPEKYYDCYCTKTVGNEFNFNLVKEK